MKQRRVILRVVTGEMRSGYDTVAAARRVFLSLTALRWFPFGVLVTLFVRYPMQRGLSLADVGLLFAALTVCVVLSELPTGGLADSWGRRNTLLLAAATGLAALGLMASAHSLAAFLGTFALMGIYWALDSGPLEAWYVDAAYELQPQRDMTRDLSLAGSVIYGATAAGALAASGVSLLPQPFDGLTVTVAFAVAVQAVYLTAIFVSVQEVPRSHKTASPTGILITLRAAARQGWRRRSLRLLLAVEICWGAGLSTVELLWQPATAGASGATNDWIFGVLAAGGWFLGAIGSAMLPLLIRLTGGRLARAAAFLRVIQGLAVFCMALGSGLTGRAGLAWIVVGYLAIYLVQGPSNAAHSTLLHRNAKPEQRATVLSLNSLIARLSGLLTSLAAGALVLSAGVPALLAAAAAILVVATPLYLGSESEPGTGDGPNRPPQRQAGAAA